MLILSRLFRSGQFTQLNRRLFSCTASMADSLSKLKPVVAVVQMTSTPDKEATFAQLSALVTRAKSRGALMTFLPECADYVSETREQAVSLAEPLEGPTVSRYQDLARSLKMWLSVGGYHEKPENTEETKRIYNTHLLIDSEGTIQGVYRKVHMFDIDIPGAVPSYESSYTVPGSRIGPPVLTVCGKVGMAICYDMRFPEMSVSLVQQGAEILTYPSAFTIPTGMAHWETLLRNRAIENQVYVIAAAQIGRHHAKRSSYGNAMVVDPWGTVLAKCHDTVDICLAEIDLPLLHKRRSEMPVLSHKRHDLYGQVLSNTVLPADSQSEYQFGAHSVKSTSVFYRTALSIAFVNRKPVLPGHVLVCPVRVVEHLTDLTAAETADLFLAVQSVAEFTKKHYQVSSLTIAVQDGPDAGQTVKHVHVHVLPRKRGDFADNDDVYRQLEKHDKNVKASEWRSDEDMASEAAVMRKYFYAQ